MDDEKRLRLLESELNALVGDQAAANTRMFRERRLQVEAGVAVDQFSAPRNTGVFRTAERYINQAIYAAVKYFVGLYIDRQQRLAQNNQVANPALATAQLFFNLPLAAQEPVNPPVLATAPRRGKKPGNRDNDRKQDPRDQSPRRSPRLNRAKQ